MFEILGYPFFQNALIGVIIISIASALIGTYITTRRMTFISGGVTHACFGGLGLGYYLGISPVLTAAVFAVISSLGVEWLSKRRSVRKDSAIAVIWALGMAIGIMFIFMTEGYVPELNSFLFGSVLTITRSDLWLFGGFTLLLIAFYALFMPLIVACSFDADFARTRRLPVRFIDYAMTVFVAVAIVLTIRMIGIMLLMSLMSLPQITAESLTRRYRPMIMVSVAVSMIGCVGGLFISYWLSVPASATIVLLLVGIFGLSRLVRPDSLSRR
jgi:zinc transport system permease protein